MKEKNGSFSEKEGSKEDDTGLGNTTWCTFNNCKFYENTNTKSSRCCQEDSPLLGSNLENIECAANRKCRFCYFLLKQTSPRNSMYNNGVMQ